MKMSMYIFVRLRPHTRLNTHPRLDTHPRLHTLFRFKLLKYL